MGKVISKVIIESPFSPLYYRTGRALILPTRLTFLDFYSAFWLRKLQMMNVSSFLGGGLG